MARKAQKKVHAQNLGVLGAAAVVLVGALTLTVVAAALDVRCFGSTVSLGQVKMCAEIAREPMAWQKGLADRAMLPKGNGMLFVFPNPAAQTFWMKGMRFPLDMVWILDGRVIGWQAHVAPDGGVRLIQTPPVDAVLEVNAGEVERLGIRVGERVSW